MDDLIFGILNEIYGEECACQDCDDSTTEVGVDIEVEELRLKVSQYEQLLGELSPVKDYVDVILEEDWPVYTSSIADDYGFDTESFEFLLYMNDILEIVNEEVVLETEHHGMGYTLSDVTEYLDLDGSIRLELDTMWTQKGRLFIYNELKLMDVLPLMEE